MFRQEFLVFLTVMPVKKKTRKYISPGHEINLIPPHLPVVHIDAEINTGRWRCMTAIVPAACMMVIAVIIMGLVTAG